MRREFAPKPYCLDFSAQGQIVQDGRLPDTPTNVLPGGRHDDENGDAGRRMAISGCIASAPRGDHVAVSATDWVPAHDSPDTFNRVFRLLAIPSLLPRSTCAATCKTHGHAPEKQQVPVPRPSMFFATVRRFFYDHSQRLSRVVQHRLNPVMAIAPMGRRWNTSGSE